MNVDRGVGEPFRLCTTKYQMGISYVAALLRGVILLDVQKIVASDQVAGVGTCQPRRAAEPCPWREWSTRESCNLKCPVKPDNRDQPAVKCPRISTPCLSIEP